MLIGACNSVPAYTPVVAPSGVVSVPITMLSARGIFGEPPPYVIAATSVASLESLVDAAYHQCGCGLNPWGALPAQPGDVLLALPVAPGFQIESVVAWRGSANTITIAEGLMQTCHGGECTAARVAIRLAVVPRVVLPQPMVTFEVAGQPGRSAVDLRSQAQTPAA